MRRTLISLLCFFGLAEATYADPQVRVYAEHQGGNVIYRYEIANAGGGEVRHVYIGCDCRGSAAGALPELYVLPVGARSIRVDDRGTWFELPADTTTQPGGWRARMLRPNGARGHWIEWYMPSAKPNAGVRPGQSLAGFSVIVPGADSAYLTANFTARSDDARSEGTSAPLALLDTTPPRLTLQANAASAEPGVTATVRVTARAEDDRDPEPQIVVESVGRTANATGYVVTYSASDASGNRATASAEVTLPAPERGYGKPVSLPRLAFLP